MRSMPYNLVLLFTITLNYRLLKGYYSSVNVGFSQGPHVHSKGGLLYYRLLRLEIFFLVRAVCTDNSLTLSLHTRLTNDHTG